MVPLIRWGYVLHLQEDSKGASMEDVEEDDDEATWFDVEAHDAVGIIRSKKKASLVQRPVASDGWSLCQDDDEPDDFMERPEGIVSMIIWLLCLPVYVPLYYTLLGTQNIKKTNAFLPLIFDRRVTSAVCKWYLYSNWGPGLQKDQNCIWCPSDSPCFGLVALHSSLFGGQRLHQGQQKVRLLDQ